MLSDKKKVYSIILDKKVKADIDRIAKEQDRSVSWLINDALKRWLEDKNSPAD